MKNFDNKILTTISLIIGFFSGIAFVNNWLILNKGFPAVGLFKVPFEASIWGTVSDWATYPELFKKYIFKKSGINSGETQHNEMAKRLSMT